MRGALGFKGNNHLFQLSRTVLNEQQILQILSTELATGTPVPDRYPCPMLAQR